MEEVNLIGKYSVGMIGILLMILNKRVIKSGIFPLCFLSQPIQLLQ